MEDRRWKIRKIKNLSIGISKLKKEIPNAARKIVASYQIYKRAYFMSKHHFFTAEESLNDSLCFHDA